MSRVYLVMFFCALALGSGALFTGQAASADRAEELSPYIEPIMGVGDPDRGAINATLAADAAVWDIEIIGNTVFVGGTFTTVTEKHDRDRHSQRYLAAFDATTGEWLSWWRPQLDGPVYALDSTTDGRLLVGGEFTEVNGTTDRAGLVAIVPATFQVDRSFRSHIERRWTNRPFIVRDLHSVQDRLYVAGNFNHYNSTRVYKAIRVNRSSGHLDRNFRPRVTGRSAHSIVESADGRRVHIGGQFTSVNVAPNTALLATVSSWNGRGIDGWSWNFETFCCKDPKVMDLGVAGDDLFVAGTNDFWARLSSRHGELRQFVGKKDTHDVQVIEVDGGRVYIGCHCSERGDWITAIDTATGEVLPSFSADWTGTDGAWAAAVAPDGCLWTGGGFSSGPTADGKRAFAGNLIKTCPLGGPEPHNKQPLVQVSPLACRVTPVGIGVEVSWNDVGARGYDVIDSENNKRWTRSSALRDLTPSASYRVAAWGNGHRGETTTCENPNPVQVPTVQCTIERHVDRVELQWTDIGARGYDVRRDNDPKIWVRTTHYTDLTPGTRYEIVAWGNGHSGERISCN